MRNLAIFFIRHHFSFLFALLELLSFLLLFNTNHYHKAKFFNITSEVAGFVYERIDYLTDYLVLKKINKELADENARLKTMQKSALFKVNYRDITINDTVYKQQYKYLSSKVVNSSTSHLDNYMILDKGAEQGIEPEMGVFNPKGVIGIVRDVSEHYCTVITILHSKTRISAMLKDSRYRGIVSWDGMQPEIVRLHGIPQHVALRQGEEVVTNGSAGLFPEGIPIGNVMKFEKIQGSNFYNIQVKLQVDFNAVHYVYIIKNLLRNEQTALEKSIDKHE